MCFSASVSYGSAALLIATGVATTLGNSSKSQRMVATIPLLFGVQQAAEGIVWQTIEQGTASSLHSFAAFVFLIFANVVWPSWIPWSFYHVEPQEKRKRILKVLGFAGLGISLLAFVVLYNLDLKAHVDGHSLAYDFTNLKRYWPPQIEFLLYFTPTMLPFFFSSLRTVKSAGVLVFISLILAQLINQNTTASVWCFFAALISLYIAVKVLWRQRGELR